MTASDNKPAGSELISRPSRVGVRRLMRLTFKELRETLRDRRTIITLVLMPLLIYPLLSVAFQKFLITNLRAVSDVTYHISVTSEDDGRIISGYLELGEFLIEGRKNDVPVAEDDSEESPAESDEEQQKPAHVKFHIAADLETDVKTQKTDIGFRITRTVPFPGQDPSLPAIDGEIIFLEKSAISQRAVEYVESRLREVNGRALKYQLRQMGIEQRMAPIQADRTAITHQKESLMESMATLIPLVLILMTITGAVYPAIDLTAGERERGTLEILIAAPVPRMGLLLAKYAAVLVVALLTATVNLAAMTITILSIGLGPLLFGEEGLTAVAILQVFGLLILFATFFSALLLSVTSFARSFKEAQAYLIPLMLVSLAPGILSMLPGLELTNMLAVAPLVNIVLLARDVFRHSVDSMTAVMVVLSTAGYALIAIAVAAKTFGSDAILYGSKGSWSDLFRRPVEQRTVPSVGSAFMCLVLMFPGFVLFGSFLGQLQDVSLGGRLGLASLVTALLCGGIPLLAGILRRLSFRDGFQLRAANPLAFVGAVLLGVSLWPFAHEIVMMTKSLGLVTFSDDLLELARKLTEELRTIPLGLVLIGLAVIPALFEEFFFRGYLLNALQARTGPAKAVVISAVCFGLFHVVARDVLAIERLLPSMFLGLVLGWVCIRSGSMLPGVVLHACNNGLLLTLSHYQKWFQEHGIGIEEEIHLPASWLIAAGIVTLAGIATFVFSVNPAARK